MQTHDPDYCSSIGHTIVNAHAVWCGHRQQWTIRWSLLHEAAADDGPDVVYERRVELGPFDDDRDALQLLQDGLKELVRRPA